MTSSSPKPRKIKSSTSYSIIAFIRIRISLKLGRRTLKKIHCSMPKREAASMKEV
jgi:hypothetical protein